MDPMGFKKLALFRDIFIWENMLFTFSKHLENKSKFCEFPDGGDTNLIHLNFHIDIVVQHLFERSDYSIGTSHDRLAPKWW